MNAKSFWFLPFLFILSGMTSLVYESLWIRCLSIAFGSTTLSISLIVALFFFGLAAGSFIGSSLINKITRPLFFYGGLEAFVGLYSFFLLFVLLKLPQFLASMTPMAAGPPFLLFLKVSTVFILISPPTLAMGMTFPILIRVLASRKHTVGKSVSLLYGLNTLGALFGAFLTGFLFIPLLGLTWTNTLMVVLNFSIAAVVLFKLEVFHLDRLQKLSFQSAKVPKKKISFFNGFLLFTTAITGTVAIGAEIIWNKYLTLFLGTNVFGISLTLSIFLLGITVGSLTLSRWPLPKQPLTLLISMVSFSIASTLVSTSILNQAPLYAQSLVSNLNWNPLFIKGLIATLILLPPTALFGALLPLTVHIMAGSQTSQAAKISGQVYGWNTLGGIVGSLTVGLYLIPQVGSSAALILVCCLQGLVLVGLVLIAIEKNQFIFLGPIQIGIISYALLFSPSVQFQNLVRSTEFSYLYPQADAEDLNAYLKNTQHDSRYWAEGENAIVSLHYETLPNGQLDSQRLILKSNGLSESFFDLSHPEVVPKYEALLAVAPYLYHSNPKNAFVVGFGGGYTTELLSNLGMEKIAVAEIEEKILEASEYVYLGPNPLLSRPSVDIKIQDARFLLSVSPKNSFDIVVSQPSHSWMSGVAHLFTSDFFEIVRSRLTDQGVFAQWLNLYNMDQQTLKSIMGTFFNTFPHGAVLTQKGDDQLILLGSPEPLQLQYDKLKRVTGDPYWQERLIHIPFNSEFDFLANISMGRNKALSLSQNAPLNTDINAYAEVRQSRLYYGFSSTSLESFLNAHFTPSIQETKKLLDAEVQRTGKKPF